MTDSQDVRGQADTEQEKCPNCGAPKRQWTKQNVSQAYPLDYDWYCGVCGKFIRVSSH